MTCTARYLFCGVGLGFFLFLRGFILLDCELPVSNYVYIYLSFGGWLVKTKKKLLPLNLHDGLALVGRTVSDDTMEGGKEQGIHRWTG